MKYHLLFIALLGLLFTAVLNADLLYMVQSRSLFMSGTVFFADCMRVPGGFLTWLGLYLTQFFYYPALGGSMLVLLWLAVYVALQRAFRPDASWSWLLLIPVVGLLVSVVDLGYWIYLLKQHGYWFRETLGTLGVALLLWVQGREQKSWRGIVAAVLALASYPLIGWYSVLSLLCMIARSVLAAIKARQGWPLTVGMLVALAFVPPMVASQYSAFRMEEAFYAGFPVIESNMDSSWVLTLPFIIVALSLILLCVLPLQTKINLGRRPWIAQTLVMIVLTAIVAERNIGEANYHAEMRMYRQVEDFSWKEVLDEIKEAADRGGSTRQMALCKDLALINTQRIDKMFDYSNGDVNRVLRDSCGAYMIYTCGPLLALHHGMSNTAIHWTIESSVEYGLSVTFLKILTLCALVNGESRVAEKYLSMLNLNLFQSSWVNRYRPLVADPSLIGQYPELTTICMLNAYQFSELMTDDGHVEAEVYKAFSNYIFEDQPEVQELGVYYALREKHATRFWAQLEYFLKAHPGEPVPRIFQEAAMLFHYLDAEHTGNLSMTFPQDLQQRFDMYNQYTDSQIRKGMTYEEVAPLLDKKFGHSYWTYYYFNRTTLY